MKINKKTVKKIINFQNVIKLKLNNLNNLNSKLNFIYDSICSIIGNIENIYKNSLIKKEKYNLSIEQVESIFNDYKNISTPLSIKDLNQSNNLEKKINDILNKLSKICNSVASSTCSDTISLLLKEFEWKELIDSKYKKLVNFYDKFFVPLSSELINENKIINDIYNSTKVENIHLPFSKSLQKKKNSLLEKIEGATIYFPINNNIIQIDGFFKQDPINITRYGGTFGYKLNLLKEDLMYLEISDEFKKKYVEQLSLRDFIVLSVREIVILIKNSYEELEKYKSKSLSSVIKEFVKSSLQKQRRIITLFLMSDDEYQFNAHIIFDLIANQTLLFQTKPHAEQIYNSLHWSIKKYFKVVLKKVQEKKRKLESLTLSDIPYESRIVAMKSDDAVKTRALNKLKDMGGSKENSSKARQYLDGLLKIPFGIYHEENIFKFYGQFFKKLENFINIVTCKLEQFDKDEIPEYLIESIKNIINNFYTEVSKNSENSIDKYLLFIKKTIPLFYEFGNFKNLNLQNIDKDVLIDLKLDKIFTKVNDNNLIVNENEVEKFMSDINKKNIEEKKNILITDINDEKVNFYKECLKEIKFYRKVKDSLVNTDSLTDNHITMIKNKIKDVEFKLGLDVKPKAEVEENNSFSEQLIDYILKESITLINDWIIFRKKKVIYMQDVEKKLEKSAYGHKEAKQQIKRLIGQWINGEMKGQCFGLSGPPGVGKTTICKNGLAKCLVDENGNTRPFAFLALGGATNGSVLEGHNYTYLGSTWGKIADILMETKCMNPIIYIDELDKVSKTQHGKEIIGILTHLTDPVQNKDFQDKYFSGIPLDLSKVLFVFSYNNSSLIDRILRDRIHEIKVKPLSRRDKIIISKKYVLPDIYKTVGFSNEEISFTNEQITDIIDNYTYEAGVRKLNEILFDIIREINLKKIMNDQITTPLQITNEFIDEIMSNKQKIIAKKIAKKPHIGMVNGLYATEAGVGGLTIIEVMHTPSEKKFSIEKLTGSQGDVMKESMHCALTLSWNILPKDIRAKIYEDGNGKNRGAGLHIHCPEASTPKDGPSAGIAITTAIVSRFCNIPVRNTIAMTGEVDLNGNVHQIGGLEAKLLGALKAGVKKVLIPYDNKADYDLIIKKEQELALNSSFDLKDPKYKKKNSIHKNLMIKFVKNIHDVLKNALVKNEMEFTEIL